MLQTLRKSVGSFVIKILFALLVLSFAIWGIGDTFFFSGSSNTVAEVGDREISVRELDGAFRNEMERLRRFNIDEQQARQLGVLDQVLERVIASALFDEAARKLGLTVSTEVVQQRIRSQFGQDITPARLQSLLRSNGMSEAQFVAQLRTEIRRGEYLGTLTDGAAAPKTLVDRLYNWRGEKRNVNLITVPVDETSEVAAPTDEQVEAYYKAHSENYTAPEYRALSYVFLDPKIVAEKTVIPEDKLREIYKERQPQLVVPEKRTVLQMLVADRASADKALDRIRKGEDFVAVAKDMAGQDDSVTRLGTVTKADLPKEIAEPVFALAQDGVSEPVQGPFGLQILKVTAIQASKTPSFEDVRGELAHDAAREQAIDSVLATTTKLEEALGGGLPLADAARDLGLEHFKIAAVDAEGQDPNDNPVQGLPAAPFLKVAFETKEGQDSLLTETNDNGFFVLRVDSVQQPALKPLDAVRGQVIDDWRSEQRWNAAREKAQQIVVKLNNGGNLSDVAKELKVEMRETGGFTRQGEGAPANMPSSLIADIFAASAVGRAALADGVGGVNVAQLTAIVAAQPANDKPGVDELKKSLGFAIASDIAGQLVDALRERYGVTVNQPVIRANFYRDAGNT